MMSGIRRPLEGAGVEFPAKRFKGADGQRGTLQETYEVRYQLPNEAMAAMSLQGCEIAGHVANVTLDAASRDQTKVIVTGLPPNVGTQELMSVFAGAGTVLYAGPARGPGGKGMGGSPYGSGFAAGPNLSQPFNNNSNLAGAGQEVYEVRYQTPMEAATAVSLSGCEVAGHAISVAIDETSKDKTKVIVSGLPPNVATHDVKSLFAGAGTVLYAGPPRRPGFGGPGFGGPAFGGPAFGAQGFGNQGFGGRGMVMAEPTSNAIGEVRYETPEEAQQAVAKLQGSSLGGYAISASLDQMSKDGSKVILQGLPMGIQWQELKDHCMQAGRVAYAGVKADVGGGCGGGFGVGGDTVEAEVRYDDPQHAMQAIQQLNNSMIGGRQIQIRPDTTSKDGARLYVSGLPPNMQWQELKDHFKVIGTVAFADIRKPQMMAGGGMIPWGGGSAFPGAMMGGFGGCGGCGFPGGGFAGGFGGGFGGGCFGAMQPACGGGKGSRKGSCAGGQGSGIGEVRYDDPGCARQAVVMLNGSFMQGSRLSVALDETSHNGSKVIVNGVPAGCQWQEVKDHFGVVGRVAFANVRPA